MPECFPKAVQHCSQYASSVTGSTTTLQVVDFKHGSVHRVLITSYETLRKHSAELAGTVDLLVRLLGGQEWLVYVWCSVRHPQARKAFECVWALLAKGRVHHAVSIELNSSHAALADLRRGAPLEVGCRQQDHQVHRSRLPTW